MATKDGLHIKRGTLMVMAVLLLVGVIVARYELALRTLDRKYATELNSIKKQVKGVSDRDVVKARWFLIVDENAKPVGHLDATGLSLQNADGDSVRVSPGNVTVLDGGRHLSMSNAGFFQTNE